MIPFNKIYLTGQEIVNIAKALDSGKIGGDGEFTFEVQKSLW